MNKSIIIMAFIFFLGCNSTTKKEAHKKQKAEEMNTLASNDSNNDGGLLAGKVLPKKLKEISGMITDGAFLWVISDNPKVPVYRIDNNGQILQELTITNAQVQDVEAVTADEDYLYIGDIGDNDGTRENRVILKIKKSSIGKESAVSVTAEQIVLTLPDEVQPTKKKKNNYDAEALLSFKDSLYLFTKRRGDDNTALMAFSKMPGAKVARLVTVFNSQGLVTDAAINSSGSEVALVGYETGHRQPFIWLLSNFSGNNFFSGQATLYPITKDKNLDWQTEGITFYKNNTLALSCEGTKDVPASLYFIEKSKLGSLGKAN